MNKLAMILSVVVLLLNGRLAPPGQPVAQVAPLTGQLAYVGAEGDVWIMEAASGQTRRVTSDAGQGVGYYSPRFSPDGRYLAYCRVFRQDDENSLPDSAIYMAKTTDLLPIRLIGDAACSFSWSPDSRSILYGPALFVGIPVPEDYVPGGIFLYDLENAASTQIITAGERALADPDWSPDGSWFSFYEACFECVGQFTTVQAQSGARYNWSVKDTDRYVGTAVSWSPDGKQLAFDKIVYPYIEPGQTSGLNVGNADGSDRREIFRSEGQAAGYPLWSHDGRKIAFSLFTGYLEDITWKHRGDLMLIDPDGSNPRLAYSWSKALFPIAWSPDDRHLLFVTQAEAMADRSQLMVLTLETGAVQKMAGMSSDVDWGLLPAVVPDQPEQVEGTIPQDSLGFLYLSDDRSLSLFFPENGANFKLSEPSEDYEFTASPSGQRVVLGQQLILLEFDQNGNLTTKEMALQANPREMEIHWSPDEMSLSYQDDDDQVWIENLDGTSQIMTGAAVPPVWSHDGEWIAYCDGQKTLWVSGSDNQPVEVAQNVICYPEWSSSQALLAYTLDGEFTPDTHQAWIYDPAAQRSTQVFAGGSIEHWSPDGALLAINRMDYVGGSAASYTIFSVDPSTGTLVELGQFHSRDLGSHQWIPVEDDYFFGRYQIAPDSGSAIQIADPLYDVSTDGQSVLSSNGPPEATNLICRELSTGAQQTLLTADLTGLFGVEMPGLWAWFSPDGQWTAISHVQDGIIYGLLSRCDGSGKINTPAEYYSIRGTFSPDSRWFVINPYPEDQADVGQLYLYGLDTGSVKILATTGMAEIYWLQTPKYTPPPTYQVSGRVLDTAGQPITDVTILVDGTPAAVTDANGAYHLSGLSQGSHTILAQGQAESFDPITQTISVPPDNQTVDFAVPQSQPRYLPKETITPKSSPESVTPEVESPIAPVGKSGTGGLGPEPAARTQLLLLILILLVLILVVLVAGAIFLMMYRRPAAQPAEGGITPVIPSAQPRPENAPRIHQGQKGDEAALGKNQLSNWVLEGDRLIRDGRLEEGKKILSQVVQRSPEHAQAWYLLGWAAVQQKDTRTAERCLLQAQKFGDAKAADLLAKLRSGKM